MSSSSAATSSSSASLSASALPLSSPRTNSTSVSISSPFPSSSSATATADSRVVSRLSVSLQCGICYDSYNSNDRIPRNFRCGHAYCAKCISSLVDTALHEKSSFVKCPSCRSRVDFQSQSDKGNVVNQHFSINYPEMDKVGMIEDHEKEEKHLKSQLNDHGNIQCAQCNKDNGTVDHATDYCSDCKDYLCIAHFTSHFLRDEFDDHKTQNVSKLKRIQPILSQQKLEFSLPLCSLHEFVMKFYCLKCQQIACSECLANLHNGHQQEKISEYVEKEKDLMRGEEEKIDQIILSLEKISPSTEDIHNVFTWSLQCEEKKINEFFDEIHHLNEKIKRKMIEKATVSHQNTLKEINNSIENVITIQQMCSNTKRKIQNHLDNDNAISVMEEKRELMKELHKISEGNTQLLFNSHVIRMKHQWSPPFPSPCPYFFPPTCVDLYVPSDGQLEKIYAYNLKYSLGELVDCCDTFGGWFVAKVLRVHEGVGVHPSVFVHFEGWETKWDETIQMDSQRLAKLGTHCTPTQVARFVVEQSIRT